jgi:hypothetical protein
MKPTSPEVLAQSTAGAALLAPYVSFTDYMVRAWDWLGVKPEAHQLMILEHFERKADDKSRKESNQRRRRRS